jgi:hypothetical protein
MPATGQTSHAHAHVPHSEIELPVSLAGASGVFCGLIDPVIVPSPTPYTFDGSVDLSTTRAIWTWYTRDLARELLPKGEASTSAELEAAQPAILVRLRDQLAAIANDAEAKRRLKVQIGGDEIYDRLPVVLHALKHRALLPKAQAFGRAANTMPDEAGLLVALQSMPLADRATTALLLHAALGQVVSPGKLMIASIRLAGGANEAALVRAGLAPMVDGILAHAQAQTTAMQMQGPFADIDRACRAIERFHKLIRALSAYVEIPRGSPWSKVLGTLTTDASRRIEMRLKDVVTDLNLAMRRRSDGHDRIDADQMLAALNGMYLLVTLRESKDSLAINAMFEQAWTQTGQALEIHITRNLDAVRSNPADAVADERLESAIKMAELRFNPEYADTLRRARTAAHRR